MDLYSTILIIHIFSAVITGGFALHSAVMLVKKNTNTYKKCFIHLSITTYATIVLGLLLAFISDEISALSLCNNIFFYVSIIFILKTLLYLRITKQEKFFSIRPDLSGFSSLMIVLSGMIFFNV